MAVTPRDVITQPVSSPYRYGLLAAATVIDDPGWYPRGEVTWRVQGCTPGSQSEYCWTGENPPRRFTEDMWRTASPFTVWDGVRCARVGFPDSEQVALSRLALSEQGQVERHLWAQLAKDPDLTVLPSPGAPVIDATTVLEGVSALEAALSARTGAVGMIHAPRGLLEVGQGLEWARPDGQLYRTPGGTPIAFGGGYSYDGPIAAVDGTAWLYATGPVVVRRGRVEARSDFNTVSNQQTAEAERPYLVTVDCPLFAVQVAWDHPTTLWPVTGPGLAVKATQDLTDLHKWSVALTGADCAKAQVTWGDGHSETVTPAAGAATATHTYGQQGTSS